MTAETAHTDALKRFLSEVADYDRARIPDAAMSSAALLTADCIAIALAASAASEVRRFAEAAVARSARPEATIFSADFLRADRIGAAAANVVSMTTAEFDGGARSTPCHAALYTVPAILAEAEATGANFNAALRALVLACEVVTEVADLWRAASAYPMLYTHAKSGTIGAAVAVALMRRASAGDLHEVICAAATLTQAGPRTQLLGGALIRNVWLGAATMTGMMCVDWCTWGFRPTSGALDDAFAGVLGLTRAEISRPPLGAAWQVSDSYHRIHATHLFMNALIEALLEVRAELPEGTGIEAIDIAIHGDAAELTATDPETSLSARFSVPHVSAAVLSLGHADVAAFSDAARSDPGIGDLRRLVRVRRMTPEEAQGARWPAMVRVVAGGRLLQAECRDPMGGHGRQVPQARVLSKIDGLTRAAWPRFGAHARSLVALSGETLAMTPGAFVEAAAGTAPSTE